MAAEEGYTDRLLQPSLEEALTDTPVVCLLGARQCGKSTLAGHLAPDRTYLSLDDQILLQAAQGDPAGFVGQLPDPVTLDEVQRVPEVLLSIKHTVDADRRPGRFLLTGSANLLQLPKLADSLAGRMEVLFLHPFNEAEKEAAPGRFLSNLLEGDLVATLSGTEPPGPSELPGRLVAGGYPEPNRRTPGRARQWHRQYLRSIIERDIHDIARIQDSTQVERLLEMVALRTAELLNLSSLGNDLDMDRQTVDRHLTVLERLFLVRRLPAWHKNSAKRLIKASKIHVCDPGLAATLADLHSEDWNTKRDQFGHLLESFVVQQLVAQGGWTDPDLRFFHYRDKDKVEVDCVITRGAKVWGVEVKASATVNPADGKGLRRLAEQAGKDFLGGALLYDGNATFRLGDERIHAVPIAKLWTD
ncbi:MAG: ATP-binding protein [Akkermansiaceae bacterium]|nr:ATP-binding protein [Akkermansiaceae bacterium]